MKGLKLTKFKNIFTITLIILTALCIYVIQYFIPSIAFNLGKQEYDQSNYLKAYPLFKLAIKLNNRDKEYRYYLVETLLKLPPTLDIQQELFNVSQVNLSDSADLIADKELSKWKNQILENIGENYIEKTPFNDKILRWDVSKFPLTVYIKNNSSDQIPPYYQVKIKQAFLQWQSSTNGFIKFAFVNNEKDANILVHINSSADMKKCEEADCKYTLAYTIPTIKNDYLEKMNITFYDTNNQGRSFSEREIYNTAIHEIGHSLGIMGHSDNKDDVMYMEQTSDTMFDKFRSGFQVLSQRDLNTISLLYKLVPDITNTDLSKFNKKYQFFAPIIMGSGKEINSAKIIEAKNYIKAAPDVPNGYIDLATAYAELNHFNEAIETLNTALSLCSNNGEKFVVNYNFAVVYMKIKDWETALKYATQAKELDPSSDIDGLIAMIEFNLGEKELAKKSYIEALGKSPDNIIDALNLSIIYIREFNLVQAGKTLNKLVEANPDAANNPKVKAFWLVRFLFH